MIGQNPSAECHKDIIFYFDVTESIFGRPEIDVNNETNPASSGNFIADDLKEVTKRLLSDEKVMRNGYGFALYEFAEKTTSYINYEAITPTNRGGLVGKVMALNDVDASGESKRSMDNGGRFNDYTNLFRQMSIDAHNYQNRASSKSNYMFLFTDLLYDDNRAGITESDRIQEFNKAFEQLLIDLKSTKYKLVIISFPFRLAREKISFSVKGRVLDQFPPSPGVVEIVDCNTQFGICNNPDALWEKLAGELSDRVTVEGSGTWIHNNRRVTAKLLVKNNTCDSIQLDSVHVASMRIPGAANLELKYSGLFNVAGDSLIGDQLRIGPKDSKEFLAAFRSNRSIENAQSLKDVPLVAPIEMFLDSSKTAVIDSTDPFVFELGVPDLEYIQAYDISATLLSTHRLIRLVFRPGSSTDSKPYRIKVSILNGSDPNAPPLTSELKIDPEMDGKYAQDLLYDEQWKFPQNQALRASIAMLDEEGNVIGTPVVQEIPMKSTSPIAVLVIVIVIALGLGIGLLLYVRRVFLRTVVVVQRRYNSNIES